MNEKTLLKLKYEDERKERERRKITNKKQQKEKENKNSQIIKFSKQKELKEKQVIDNEKTENFETPKIVFDNAKINFKQIILEKNIFIQRKRLEVKIPNIKLTTDKSFITIKIENSFLIPKFNTIPLNYVFLNTGINKDFNIPKTKKSFINSKVKILKPVILKYEEKSSIIPKIAISEPSIDFKKIEINKGLEIKATSNIRKKQKSIIKEIQREKLKLKIPNIKLTTPYYEFLNINVDKSFNITKAENPMLIPKFKVILPNFTFLKTEINIDFNIPKAKNDLFIPKIEILDPEIKYTQKLIEKSFNIPKIAISELSLNITDFRGIKMTKNLEIKEIPNIQKEKQESVTKEIKEDTLTEEIEIVNTVVLNENETKKTEIEVSKEPIEFLFGGNVKGIKRGEPLIVLFKDYKDDSYIQTFETLLLRICREKYGGIPEVKKLSLKEDWNKYEIERYLDEGNIFLIELESEEEINKDNLADRLWAIFSKEKGIVIFYTKSKNIFEKYKTILNEINWTKLNLKAKIIEIIPKRLSFKEKINVAKALFGFMDIEKDVPPIAPMDAVLNFAKEKYKEKLEKINNKYHINLGIINEGENESKEHMNLKSFVTHCLIKKLEKDEKIPKDDKEKDWDYIKENIIITEYPKEGKNNNILVDVYFVDKNENYEIETLFEEGFGKIHKTLEKYNPNEKINIVVENITALLHAKEFLNLINLIEKKQRYKNLEINFYTLDIKNNKLINLKDYYKKLKL